MSQPYLAVFAPSWDAAVDMVFDAALRPTAWCGEAQSQLSAAFVASTHHWLGGIPPRAACRPRPKVEPIGTYFGMPLWIDPLCPRDTWYLLGVYDPEPVWPSIASGVQ